MPLHPIAVALFNDTGNCPHVGCLAVSQSHRRMLKRAHAVVRHAFFINDWRQLEAPSLQESIARAAGSPGLRRVLAETEAVVVNGEGTIHHGRGRHLLGILATAQRAGVPTYLVNAVLQDVDDAREILCGLTDCTVRDSRSAAYLAGLAVPHRLVPDSIFESDFLAAPTHDFGDSLVITDCHPERASDFRDAIHALEHAWHGRIVRYELESAERVHDWRHAVADLRGAAAVVTGRHHGACLAVLAGVPFVALPSNTWKVEGLIEQLEGYPSAADDAALPLIQRVEAALDSRAWFRGLPERYPQRPLSTFTTIRRVRPAAPVQVPMMQADPALIAAVTLVTRPGGGVLHCGAGTSDLVPRLLAEGVDAWGIDTAPIAWHSRHQRLLQGSQDALPFGSERHFTVVVSSSWLEHLEPDELQPALAELGRVTSDTIIATVSSHPCRSERAAERQRRRCWWEHRFLEAGFRRHTQSLRIVNFEALEEEGAETTLVFQKLPPRATAVYPLHALAPERDLHVDMLRETGRRADAHIARYEWARGWIRPGDVVVDAACGLGYGSAVLWDGSEASRVIGLDLSASAVEYARENYAPGRPGVEFRAADVETWGGWGDASVDCIVSFETLEHLVDPTRFLAGARRVLKPGGRFLVSVPHAWVDETGRDPNPHHLHVFDLGRLVDAVSPFLLIDQVYAQSAGGHTARFAPRRLLRDLGWPEPVSERVDGAEWLLLSGVRDPLKTDGAVYTETVFPSTDGEAPNAIAFARDYVNPWAVHALVMGSFRVRSAHLLATLASRWLAMSPPESADAGAALCVLAYRQLARCGTLPLEPPELERRIRDYCAFSAAPPQVHRWQISLLFVLGRIRLQEGDLAEAEAIFRVCAAEDASAFTPHLETKTTEAAWLAGRLALERGDAPKAAETWSGVAAALERLKSASVADWLITPERPAAFETGDGLREVTIAIDNATLCGNGLRRLRDPSGVWRPGPEPIDRNHQRNIERLLQSVHQRGGEIVSLREALDRVQSELQQAHEGWRVARETLHMLSQQPDRLLREELCRCRAERAALLARASTSLSGHRDGHQLRVGIFGTGEAAMRVWQALSDLALAEVAWFADNDGARQGQRLLWIDVLAPDTLPTHPVDAVVIGSMHVHAIRGQLVDLGFDADRIVAADVTRPPEQLHDELRQEFERMRSMPAAAGARTTLHG